VVVESPAKAKTINKYLGSGYEVKASMGHVRDLPKRTMGVKINGGFRPDYAVIPERKKTVEELRRAAKTADRIYFATDLDREGEAIAWHLSYAMELPQEAVYRVIFNEITREAIREAFEHPGRIDENKVNAQQARRILDRVVGYELSPLLWKKIAGKLSAGRVQSVAVRLVVEREKEIRAFKPQEYWTIEAELETSDKGRFVAELVRFDGKRLVKPPSGEKPATEETENAEEKSAEAETEAADKAKTFWISSQAESDQIVEALKTQRYIVASVEAKERTSNPPPPFTTSTLQQQASVRLRFRSALTMSIAQQLYEGVNLGTEGSVALITYMRTDSVRVADQAISQCRKVISTSFGDKYLPSRPNVFRSKESAQGAHEAVRPTEVARTPEQVRPYLTDSQYKLYELIWRRFVASQMAPARYLDTKVEVVAGPGLFQAKGSQLVFEGHTRLSGHGEDKLLPALKEQQPLTLIKLDPKQRFTQPPPRYTEAALIKALEREGIGRPSTYAPIISTIQQRGYVKQQQRIFSPTDLGILVTDKLVKHFPDIMDVRFTAHMEAQLDRIEESGEDWQKVLREFYEPFQADLKKAKVEMTSEKGEAKVSDVMCKECGKPMVERWSKTGKFLGCSGFPKCKFTMPLNEAGEPAPPQETGEKCDKCGAPMVIRTSKRGRFLGCSAYPNCRNTKPLSGQERTSAPAQPGAGGATTQAAPTPAGEPGSQPPAEEKPTCNLCGKPMVMRWSKRGPFWGCSGFPACRNIIPASAGVAQGATAVETGEKCDKCGAPMVIRSSRRGRFLGCSAYPKCKNIKPIKGEPPQETGETCDKCGKPMVIRTSARGKFLGCSGYPKCRNIKPFIEKPAEQ
jgi:DNA topoisomerase-1